MNEVYSGVSRGVIYPSNGPGVGWNGLVGVVERPDGIINQSYFFDGIQTHRSRTTTEFAAQVRSFTIPDDFNSRKRVGLTYTTGRETANSSGYDIHILYDVLINHEGVTHQSTGDTQHPVIFQFDLFGLNIDLPNGLRGCHFVISSVGGNPDVIFALENILYGTPGEQPRLPTFVELEDIFQQHAVLVIIDHGDGTWSAIGPDHIVKTIDVDLFEIDWPSAIYLDDETYKVSSL